MKLERELKWIFPATLVLFAILFAIAFINAPIQADDAWLGQQVNSLIDHGEIRSSLFLDFPPLDDEIVVYHKLLIWTGAGICEVFGWGLHQLRLLPVICGLLTLVLLYRFPVQNDSKMTRKLAILLLLFTPVFWNKQLLFRPDPMVMLFGFMSFLVLMRARDTRDLRMYILSGALAGLAALAHPLGLAFAAAALILSLMDKRLLPATLHLVTAGVFFLPYLSGLFTDPELFTAQMFDNDLMLARVPSEWWTPLLSIAEEHKRLFRKPEIIGISTLFLLSLAAMGREQFRRHRAVLVYISVLIVVIAIPPFPKMTQYSVPLMPFFALVIARAFSLPRRLESVQWRSVVRRVRNAAVIILMAYGTFALVHAAFFEGDNLIETNRKLASTMRPGSLVMAPFDFVFPNDDRFTIVSWRGLDRAAGPNTNSLFLDNYADSIGVEYIVADGKMIEAWDLRRAVADRPMESYHFVLSVDDPVRYLFERSRSFINR